MGTSVSQTGHLQRLEMRKVQQQLSKARREQKVIHEKSSNHPIEVQRQEQKELVIEKEPPTRQPTDIYVNNQAGKENKSVIKHNSPIRLQPITRNKQIPSPIKSASNIITKSEIISWGKGDWRVRNHKDIENEQDQGENQQQVDQLVLQEPSLFQCSCNISEEDLHVNLKGINRILPPPKTKSSIMKDRPKIEGGKVKEGNDKYIKSSTL